jgi:cytochrome c oxidase cbb3-type subunit 3
MAAAHKDVDQLSGTETTGHEWDGIKELNTPLPKWWVYVFYATIVWSIGYWIVYPAWPTLTGFTPGIAGYSSRAEVETELADLRAARQVRAAGLEQASLDQIRNDPTLRQFAMAQGRAAFGDNCAPCHGTGGQGSVGYPNLNDDHWIWGGRLSDIQATIANGIRNTTHPEARMSQMPAFGRDGILNRQQIADVTSYLLSLSRGDTAGGDVARGRTVYVENCAACHGDDGRGNAELGAPNMVSGIWLFGGSRAAIIESITNGRAGVMPGSAGRLDPVTIKSLTVYVHALGGGQ